MKNDQKIIDRNKLYKTKLDINGKAIIIGFNEAKFRKSNEKLPVGDIDSKLNARFISYFLPAVEIAKKQKQKPRFVIVSGLNMALRYNAKNYEQKKIMIANNAIKFDFLKYFFERYFDDDFSLVEYIIPQDTLKVPESKLTALWRVMEKKFPKEVEEIKFQLTKFLYPHKLNAKSYKDLSIDQKKIFNEVDATAAFNYAIGHLFGLGDINFEGNYIHSDKGYVSVGGESEEFFNGVRNLAYEIIKDYGELLFDREVTVFKNDKIVLINDFKVPPPYNGMFQNGELLEVTYENGKTLDYYDSQEKLKPQMDYMYKHIIAADEYETLWNEYKERYFKLKKRFTEAYQINSKW